MKRSFQKIFFSLLFAVMAVFSGCLKHAPDSPPDTTQENPALIANTSIQQLKSLPLGKEITSNRIISGVVIMSDQSGNYFKKIVLQDSTGGIEIELDQSYLYRDYPVGRKVYVKCDGLFLSDKNGMTQLGYSPDANGYVQPVPQPMIKDFLFPGQFPVNVHPDTLSITQLAIPKDAKKYLNSLVVIKDVEFVDSNTAIPFALPSDIAANTTRWIHDCSGAVLPLQTSGYANFQAMNTPTGNGTMIALYTRYDEQPQLTIRNTSDIRFEGERCSHLPPAGSQLTILQLRQLFSGLTGNVTLGNFNISGIVISEKNQKNTASNTLVIQGNNNDAGIVIILNHASNFNSGDSLHISVDGGKLENNYGTLVIKNLYPSAFQLVGQNKIIRPKILSISQLKANPKSFDSRLVTIKNIRWLQFPSTFNGQSGNLPFSDGTDSMNHFCLQGALFRNTAIPQPTAISITGYIFIRNNQVYLKMRNPSAPEDDLKQ